MSSKREEERNEKIIRGLLKLPPNRKCINCNSLGPQYVCTNFWTFVCVTCSGVHREFTHRVKSISMAKFTSQEVEALQKGGNQRAREIYLNDWDSERMRLPDSGNVTKIREFIRSVYVDKKYAGGKSSGKPPRDMQSHKTHEEHKRASSYHSFSQSPPYEGQYEERRYGKQTGMLSRKPGSDHGRYESKMSSFIYSPGHQGEEGYDDRFSNDTPRSRNSDYSNTSPPFRSDIQSPNSETGHTSPPFRPVRDILIEDSKIPTFNPFSEANVKKDGDVVPQSQRTLSSSSFGSLDSNSANLVETNSTSLIDIVLEPEHPSGIQKSTITSSSGSLPISATAKTVNQDFFNLNVMQTQAAAPAPAPSTDLFSLSPQLPTKTNSTENPLNNPFNESVGWATFDFPHQGVSPSETHNSFSSVTYPDKNTVKVVDNTSLFADSSQWFSGQNLPNHAFPSSVDKKPEQWGSANISNTTQTWNAFDEPMANASQITQVSVPTIDEKQVLAPELPKFGIPDKVYKAPEATVQDEKSITEVWNAFSDPTGNVPQATHVTVSKTNDEQFMVPQLSAFGELKTTYKPSEERTTLERKSTNPFDLLDDSDVQENNVLLDMSSLHTVLPSSELSNNIHGDLHQAWYQPNPMMAFVSSVPQGALAYVPGQLPGSPLRDLHTQGPAPPVGGNPFD